MNKNSFQKLDRIIHERGRLAIVSLLAATPEMSFTELRDALEMTDGNLSLHLRTLQEAGYVAVTKAFVERRPLTTCALTKKGVEVFTNHLEALEEIVRQGREFTRKA